MHERHAYFSELANNCKTLEEFAEKYDRLLAVLGIELNVYESPESWEDFLPENRPYISLWMQLDYTEYEQFFVYQTRMGSLKVSNIIMWQDEACANSDLDIFEE